MEQRINARHQMIDEIVSDALDLNGAARADFLAKLCAADDALRAEVESILAHAQQSISQESTTLTLRGLKPLEVIDNRWTIIRHIASGGMGDVYEAADRFQQNRRVALKAIRPGVAMDPKMVIRFKQEVRIGQEVTHRNI